MTTYTIRAPNGVTYTIEGPEGASQADVAAAVIAKNPEAGQPAPEPKKAPFSVRDTGLALGTGALSAGKALTDLFGADNAVSRQLGDATQFLSTKMTPARQQEKARRQEDMRRAEQTGSTWEELKSAAAGVAEAPIQSLAEGLGSLAPYIATGGVGAAAKAGVLGSKAAALTPRAFMGINTALGAAQGAGAVKGSIYDAVYQRAKEAGMSDEDARAEAAAQQSYASRNIDQIALGGGLGAAAARFGVEGLLLPGAEKKLAPGLARRVGAAVASEVPMEAAQGGQERLAANVASQRAGYDTPTWQGVVGQAAQEGLMAGLSAGAVGAVRSPRAGLEQDARKAKEEAAKVAQQRAAEEKAADDARKATPEYAQEVEQNYRALEQRDKELRASLIKLDKDSPTYTADKLANKDITAEIARFRKEELAPAAAEWNKVKANANRSQVAPETPAVAQDTAEVVQTDLLGDPLAPADVQKEPEVPPEERLGELQQQIRLLGGMEDGMGDDRKVVRGRVQELQDAVAQAKTPDEVLTLGRQYTEAKQALDAATTEFHKLHTETKAPSADTALAKKYMTTVQAMQRAQEEGDVEQAVKLAAKVQALNKDGVADIAVTNAAKEKFDTKGAAKQKSMSDMPVWRKPAGAESTDSFNQRVIGPEMAAGREATAAARKRVEDELAAIQGLAQKPKLDNAYQEVRQERANDKANAQDIAAMEAARMVGAETGRTDQMSLLADLPSKRQTVSGPNGEAQVPAQREPDLATPALRSEIHRGVGMQGRTEAELVAEIQAARATRNTDAARQAIEELRDLRAGTNVGANTTPAGEMSTALAGTQPPQASKLQDANIARGQSLAKLLMAPEEDVDAARGRVLERLAAEIEAANGTRMPQSQRYEMAKRVNPVLESLLNKKVAPRRAQELLDNIRNNYTNTQRARPVETTFAPYRTEQQSKGNINAGPLPQETIETFDATPEVLQRSLDTAMAKPDVAPEQRALLERVADNLPAIQNNPERRAMVADWLYRDFQIGQPTPRAAEDVRQDLDTLEQGKRSETETTAAGTTSAVQQDMFPRRDVQGTLFSTHDAFDAYLGGEALHRMRLAMGKVVETLARAARRVVPMRKRAEALRANVVKLQQQYAAQQQAGGAEVAAATAAHEAAQDRLQNAIDKINEALRPLEEDLWRALHEHDVAVANSQEISQRIAGNVGQFAGTKYQAAAQEVSDAKTRFMEARQSATGDDAAGLEAALKAHADVLAAERKMLPLLKKDVNEAALLKFMEKDLNYQMQLATELQHVYDAMHNLTAAQMELDMAEQELASTPGVQRQVTGLRGAADRAGRVREATRQRVGKQLVETSKAIVKEDDAARAETAEADAIMEPVLRAQRDRVAPARGETQADREARDAGPRVKERRNEALRTQLQQKVADETLSDETRDAAARRLAEETPRGELPGSRVTHDAYRDALERLDEAPARIAELQRKSKNTELPTATRNKARHMELVLRRAVRLASGMLSNDPERLAEARSNVQARMDVVGVAIEKHEAVKKTPGLPREKYRYRRDAIAELRREMRVLKELMAGLENRAEVTPLQTSSERSAVARDREAELYMERVAAMDETGTAVPEYPDAEGGQRAQRRIGPLTRKATNAGNFRTGNAETVEQRSGNNRNPVRQDGKVRGLTGTQAAKAAGKDTAYEQAMLALSNVEDLQERNDTALERAREAGDKALVDKHEAYKTRLETAHQAATKKLESVVNAQGARDEFVTDDEDTAKVFTDATGTLASAETRTALRDGDIQATARGLIAGASKEVGAFVRNLLPFLDGVKIGTDANVKHKGKTVAGLYSESSNSITMHPDRLTEEDIVHELTHAATATVLNTPDAQLTPQQAAAKRGLTSMWEAMRNNPAFQGEYATENVKEFASEVYSNPLLRERMDSVGKPTSMLKRFATWIARMFGGGRTDSEKATAMVTAILSPAQMHFRGESTPSVLRATAPAYEDTALDKAAKAVIAQPKTFKERMGNNLGLETEMQLVDMRAGVREALKAGAADMGNDKDFRQAMYSLTKSDQRMTLVNTALSEGFLETYTDAKGYHGVRSSGAASGKDVFAAVAEMPGKDTKAKMARATMYMIAQRAENVGFDRLNMGDLDVTEAQLKASMAEINANPELKSSLEKVRKVYNAYNAGMIKFLADTGAIPKARADALLKNGDYVPYYRVDANGMAALVFDEGAPITIGDVRHQPYLATLKGGQTKIMPINESIPRNTMLLVDKAMTNLAAKNVAYAAQAYGAGHIQKGISPAAPDVIRFNQEPDPNDKNDEGERWIQIKTEGTAMEGIPSALVVKSLEGAHLTLPAFLKWGAAAGDLLRSGVTRSPLYVLRQLWRDPMIASFTGGLNYGPLKAIVKAGKEFVAQSRDTSATGAELARKGLIQSQIFNGDADDLAKISLQLAAGKDANAIDRVLAMADRAAMRADAATRALVYENAIANGMSEVEADMATMESMNFHKRGLSPSIQYASRMIPFFNAQIQGLNVLYKAARGQMPYEQQLQIKRKFMHNATMLMVGGLAYAMAMQDDDDFRNAKPRDRYTNFFIPLPGVDSKLKLPIPYEAGWFYSAAVAMVDAMREDVDNPEQFRALRDMFVGSVPGATNLFLPQLVKPTFEVWTNKNFLSGQDIETAGQRRLDPAERYNASTTEAAKMLAQVLPGLSPVQLEHLVRGYLGTIPLMAAAAANELFTPQQAVERPDKRLTDEPLVGGLFQREYGGADVDAAYKASNKAQETKNTLDKMIKEGRREEAMAYRNENRSQLKAANVANIFEQRMNELKEIENRIRSSSMTGEAKRERLDALDAKRQQVAAKIRAKFRQVEEAM